MNEDLNRQEQVLTRIRNEELAGNRVTVHSPDGLLFSVTKNSHPADLENAHRYLDLSENEKLADKVRDWLKLSRESQKEDFSTEPIRLKSLRRPGFHVLRPDTHPDILEAICKYREIELGDKRVEIILGWIEKAQIEDHPERIRLFHDGLDAPENSTEIDLSKFKHDYVEQLLQHLSKGEAELVPEHKRRLDKYYEKLQRNSLDKEFELQLPLDLEGKTIEVRRFADGGVLGFVYEKFSDKLGEESKERLRKWRDETQLLFTAEDTVRIYDRDDPNRFQELHKYRDFQHIEQAVSQFDERSDMTQADYAKANKWVAELKPIMSEHPAYQTASLYHISGVILDLNRKMVHENPTKIVEALNSPDWFPIDQSRQIIETWLHQVDRNPEAEIVVNGSSYSRNQPTEELKQLAGRLVDEEFESLSAESAKKLLSWIHTKEKYGENYYLEKEHRETFRQNFELHGKAMVRSLGLAAEEIEKTIGWMKTVEQDIELRARKDEPQPGL